MRKLQLIFANDGRVKGGVGTLKAADLLKRQPPAHKDLSGV